MFAKLTLKTDDFDKRIDKATTRGKNAEKGMDILQKAVEKMSPETHALSNKLSVLTEQYNKQKEGVKKLTDEFNAEVKASGASSEAAQALKEKLDEAQKRMASTAEEMDKVKKSLTDATTESGKANTRLSKLSTTLGTGLANAAKIGATAIVTSTTAAVGAVTAITKKSVEAYANYEQLEGGIGKLFGTAGQSLQRYLNRNLDMSKATEKQIDRLKEKYAILDQAQTKAMGNAKKAYKSVGMSQNTYMESIMGFSAALKNSLGGDSIKAAEMADKAMRSIADNANTFGKYSVKELSDVYTALSKGMYQTLDNLMLGYKGSKEGMQALIKDANALKRANGEVGKLSIDNFADIVEAIDLVQQKMNIAGTTRREAASTIEGSGNMVKAAWENVLIGFADPEQNIRELVHNLIESVITYLGNLMPRVGEAFAGIGEAISYATPVIIRKIPEQLESILPTLLETAVLLVTTLGTALLENAPSLIENGITLLSSLVTTFVNNIPQFVDFIVQMIKEMRKSLIGSSPKLIAAGLTLIGGLVGGLLQAFVALGGDFIKWIWDGAKEAFEDLKKRALTWGGDMINGFIDGIKAKIEDVKAAASSVANAVKNFLHFSRPDVGPLREYEKWMPDFMAGLAKGINQNKYLVTDEIKDLADEMRIDSNFDKLKIDKSGRNGNGKLGAVSVVQNIYSKAQTASDLMQEALYQQKKAVLLGNV